MNGMDDNEDEHNFSDDDFADLPDSTLRQLEQNALVSTQQAIQPQPTSLHKPIANLNSRPSNHRPQYIPPLPPGRSFPWDKTDVQILEDDFELEGDSDVRTPIQETEDFLPGHRPPDEVAQREQWRLQRFAPTRETIRQIHPQQQEETSDRVARSIAGRGPLSNNHDSPDLMLLDGAEDQDIDEGLNGDQNALRLQLQHLSEERDRLQKMVQDRNGEIAIVRANYEKDSTTHQRQITALRKVEQEKELKHQAAVQAKAEEIQRLVTENKFYKHELEQEAEKSKSLQSRLKDKPNADRSDALLKTPKKGHAESLRDGFEDDEIMFGSPVKSGRRSKPVTPTAAGKRKRKSDIASPIRPLVLRQSGMELPEPVPPPSAPKPSVINSIVTIRPDPQAERSLHFLQKILQYRLRNSEKRLIEALVEFRFPSDQDSTFSSIILDRTASLNKGTLRTDLLLCFIELLEQTLKESYYKPFAILIEIIQQIIDRNLQMINTEILGKLLPVLQNAIRINGTKRFEHSPVNRTTYGNFHQTPQAVLNHDVNGTSCLEIMYVIARACLDEPDLIETFWSTMDAECILMILNAWQPLTDVTLMLHLLSTSILRNSFGKICPTPEEQSKWENHTIERVCYLLWETMRVDEGLKPYTKIQICRFRLEIIQLLTEIAITSSPHPHDDPNHYGTVLLAEHPSAIARIVRSIYDEADAMYNLTPSHELHAELVNRGVKLLFHLMQTRGNEIDLRKKLSAVSGGIHKHRIALTRLAFSQGLYIDRLVSGETVEMATRMLEDTVTPDEAEQLVQAFPHVMSGHRRSTQEEK